MPDPRVLLSSYYLATRKDRHCNGGHENKEGALRNAITVLSQDKDSIIKGSCDDALSLNSHTCAAELFSLGIMCAGFWPQDKMSDSSASDSWITDGVSWIW